MAGGDRPAGSIRGTGAVAGGGRPAQDGCVGTGAVDEREAVAARYAEHLTDADLRALTGGRREQVAALRSQPALVLDLLDRPRVADALLVAGAEDPERFTYVSPFLVFAAAVHRVSSALIGTAYVTERTGPRGRLPVFDGPQLAAFATEPRHRLFLAELLASYARITSGVAYARTPRRLAPAALGRARPPPAGRPAGRAAACAAARGLASAR